MSASKYLHHYIPTRLHLHHGIPTRVHLYSLHTYKRTFTPWHTPKRTFASWHTLNETFAFIAYPSGHWHSLHTQGDICIHCIPTKGICIMACTMGTFVSWYTYKGAFTSWYTHRGMFVSLHITKRIFASWHTLRVHLHHDTTTRVHLHHDIPTRNTCIMTYPLEGICTARHLHLHLYKKTFALRLNMCTDTIMDKLCICTLAWDICIMKIASLKGDMCIIWIFCICILVKIICIENEKFRLALHVVCIHRKLTSRSVVKSPLIAY